MSGEADAHTFDLDRFVRAQDRSGSFPDALRELQAGRKRGHWMWFIFPQIAGLGSSANSRRYAISSLAEARAYLGHPLLGPRLAECVEALLRLPGADAQAVFGPVDALKLRSSMTLFAEAQSTPGSFHQVLDKFFSGQPDGRTLGLLADRLAETPPEKDLTRLIGTMRPERLRGDFVFVQLVEARVSNTEILAFVREPEGVSAVIHRQYADRLGLEYSFVAGWITLRVNSALDAVGLTAAVSACLSERGISCNVIAGLHHDHLLVPVGETEDALEALRKLSAAAGPEYG